MANDNLLYHPDTEYKAVQKLIRHFAYRVQQRAHAAGARSVLLEDIISECGIAWCVARDHWNPNMQVPFGSYLYRGMQQHINRWIQKEIGQSVMAPMSMDATMFDDAKEGVGHVTLTDPEAVAADIQLIEKDIREKVMKQMSDATKLFVELVESPPPELVQELRKVHAKSKFARDRGLAIFVPAQLSAALIFDFMGLTRAERSKIYAELRRLAAEVNQK